MDSQWTFSSTVQFQLAQSASASARGEQKEEEEEKEGWLLEFKVDSNAFLSSRSVAGASIGASVQSTPANRDEVIVTGKTVVGMVGGTRVGQEEAKAPRIDAVYTLLRCDSKEMRRRVRESVKYTLRHMGAWLRQLVLLIDTDWSASQAHAELGIGSMPRRHDGSGRVLLLLIDVRRVLSTAKLNLNLNLREQEKCISAVSAEATLPSLAKEHRMSGQLTSISDQYYSVQ